MTSTEITKIRRGCLHEIFERQAEKTPEATAISCGSQQLTYAELDWRSNQLARLLDSRGVMPRQFVAIYFNRSELPIIALLACLKSGTAYVPLDPTYPGERIRYIASELGISTCLTEDELAPQARQYLPDAQVVVCDTAAAEVPRDADPPWGPAESDISPLSPTDLAYVIYTSGSTGRPKGVMVEHRAVTGYVHAFNNVCATNAEDRVYQGFSLSFDGSVEEIWMAFSNGSALVVPTKEAPRFGDDLGRYLTRYGVSYLSTVPTLLSTLTEDVPSLRTVVLSGEVCPPELVNRWTRPGRRLLNVYGPTEATVNTTVAECDPDLPVTIGRPLEGYGIHVVDEHLQPVARGAKGELLISGPTLARGYAGQPQLTAQRFLTTAGIAGLDRLYRTGDLVRWTERGDLEFHGRIDTQVKIRGYRVELSEIESLLVEHPRVRTAAVRLVEHEGLQQLAAYVVVAGQGHELDRESILNLVESRVPPYMVPSHLDVLPEMPRTTSGKIDRARLPAPVEPLVHTSRSPAEPRSQLEREIVDVWREVLGVWPISTEDDFFLTLGGHSLLAARMVTRLRERISQAVSVRDVYECPTVRTLAQRLESQPQSQPQPLPQAQPQSQPQSQPCGQSDPGAGAQASCPASSRASFHSIAPWRRFLTFTLQVLSVYLVSAVAIAPIGLLFLLGYSWVHGIASTRTWLLGSAAVFLLAWPFLLATSIAAKWVVIGRYRPGAHPLWGLYYWRWWFCARIQALSGAGALTGTPLLPLYYRLMGARVGKGCTLDTADCAAWDLVSIGNDTSVGAHTQLLGTGVEDGMLRLGTVDIGSGCFVGTHCALGLGVRMRDGSALDDQSLLPDGQELGPGGRYRGSPAGPAQVSLPNGVCRARRWRRFLFGGLHLGCAYLLGLCLTLPALGFFVLWQRGFLPHEFVGIMLALFGVVVAAVVMYCLLLAGLRRVILNRMRPGTYPVESLTYLRKWLSDGLVSFSRNLLLPVYTTLYLPPWLRLMGSRIGPRAELSTVWSFAPELIQVGPESFLADGSIVGGRRAHRGVFEVSTNELGRRSFIGNNAVLPVGTSLGDRCLLGVQSSPPDHSPRVPDGSEWLGSPSFPLTHRPKVGNFDETVTFHPTRALYLQRALIDGLRILIPGYLTLAGLLVWSALTSWVLHGAGLTAAIVAAPVFAISIAVGTIALVAGLKKAVMGTFKPEIKPLWSRYVWLNEMINGAYEAVVARLLVPLLGTPFVVPLLRLMGCRIGKHTYIATTHFSEFDLVDIGDYAALNHGVVVQNHLFEDRVFKSSHLAIGPETSVGNMSVILYDSRMARRAVLGPLSLLMKGETLAEGTRWHGIPAMPVRAPDGTAEPAATIRCGGRFHAGLVDRRGSRRQRGAPRLRRRSRSNCSGTACCVWVAGSG